MKTQRYADAILRNVNNAIKNSKKKYEGMTLEKAKHKLGVKIDDDSMDSKIKLLITKGK